jgi:hypothetical protein
MKVNVGHLYLPLVQLLRGERSGKCAKADPGHRRPRVTREHDRGKETTLRADRASFARTDIHLLEELERKG